MTDTVEALKARVLRLVEGVECDHTLMETESGVGVCIEARCPMALADAITVEDYETWGEPA